MCLSCHAQARNERPDAGIAGITQSSGLALSKKELAHIKDLGCNLTFEGNSVGATSAGLTILAAAAWGTDNDRGKPVPPEADPLAQDFMSAHECSLHS